MVSENCGAISISEGSRPSAAARALSVLMRSSSALDGRHVVAAEPERKRLAPGLGIHLDVAHGVVLALVRDAPFAEQAAHQLQSLVHHLAALCRLGEPGRPGGEL